MIFIWDDTPCKQDVICETEMGNGKKTFIQSSLTSIIRHRWGGGTPL